MKALATEADTTLSASPNTLSPATSIEDKYDNRIIQMLQQIRRLERAERERELFEQRKRVFVRWYRMNRPDLNYYFKDILYSIYKHRIYLLISHKELYNRFVDFTFEHSTIVV